GAFRACIKKFRLPLPQDFPEALVNFHQPDSKADGSQNHECGHEPEAGSDVDQELLKLEVARNSFHVRCRRSMGMTRGQGWAKRGDCARPHSTRLATSCATLVRLPPRCLNSRLIRVPFFLFICVVM